MKSLLLRRREFNHGCFSDLVDEETGLVFGHTVEKPWLNNEPFISCVPYGTYDLLPHNSPKFGKCYALQSPNLGVTISGNSQRTHCLFHVANLVEEVTGCVGLGLAFGVIDGKWAVLHSADAMKKLSQYLGGKPAKLTIVKG